jgi:acetate kinase
MTVRPVILCVNSGSSSLKFALYQCAAAAKTVLADGAVERIGMPARP